MSDLHDDVGRHLLIRGHVQGVGFRWFMFQEARKLKLDGWVRNRRDGQVEALVSGPQAAVAALVHWASYGPSDARVDEILVEDTPERAQGFEKRPTI
ncbi:acylphosphatase [Uliginosibacterium sp. 31-16]|uniref:acylphosphatase n=1 Tax=Uliginosibacterium sp. 31-16 TaxID=3068315 RepID=UPI00273F13F6|nr:acylphosphatase [Uliginosibacterium sp. 31-16]MDP5240105.1 acylphosphatase [Uliginosibacterium sp. 31-16]